MLFVKMNTLWKISQNASLMSWYLGKTVSDLIHSLCKWNVPHCFFGQRHINITCGFHHVNSSLDVLLSVFNWPLHSNLLLINLFILVEPLKRMISTYSQVLRTFVYTLNILKRENIFIHLYLSTIYPRTNFIQF